MKKFNCDKIQHRILRLFYKIVPFNTKGGLEDCKRPVQSDYISCLIISNKLSFLKNILEDLHLQSLSKKDFEVVIVFDGQGEGVTELVEEYHKSLNIYLHKTGHSLRVLSDLRNMFVAFS